jgi:hypothetical protein
LGNQALAQTQNALDFDGVNDQIIVSNAATVLAGATAYTMTMWVKPLNAGPAWPDFDGFAGFRDDVGADYYITQVGPTLVEARYRNSAGTAFDISYDGVPVNTWSHLAMVFDGASLILYHNGAAVMSVPASGTLSPNPGDFLIGNSFYGPITNFWLHGQVDDVSLWSTALTNEQVQCIANSGIELDTPGLGVYYTMDEGTAGGNNTAITSLTDAMGMINGMIDGLALSGSSSNFVDGAGSGTYVLATICPGGSYDLNGQILTDPGVYSTTYVTGGACDSVVNLTLSVIDVNTNVSQNGVLLTCLNGSAQWQWLDCDNGYAVIPGATFQSYSAAENGSYAVRVTANGCVDTSACFMVNSIGFEELGLAAQFHLATTLVGHDVILLPGTPKGELTVAIMDAQGRVLASHTQRAEARMPFDVADLPAGSYVLRVESGAALKSLRFVKL